MASSPAPASSTTQRRFHPVRAGKCYRQTVVDRFGIEGKAAVRDRERAAMAVPIQGAEIPFVWPGNNPDDDASPQLASIYQKVPSMQSYRNNLTALSQVYNLYFSAYQGRIFVYVPKQVMKQCLSSKPALQLIPKPSEVATRIGGYLEPAVPHAINHLIVGDLGSHEVLLTCHDDGDVTAYYTREIAEWVASVCTELPVSQATKVRPRVRTHKSKPPVPFFLENVGASAWGLALHAKSRLIAVSSNRWEVTVFAPALSQPTPKAHQSRASGRRMPEDDDIEEFVRSRVRNCRIVIVLGYSADNVPNVCFLDDDNGNAEKICTVDIRGCMWLAEIWTSRQPLKRIQRSNCALLRSEEFWPEVSRGWGVMALKNEDFKEVNSIEELVGGTLQSAAMTPTSLGCTQPTANIYSCVREIPDNPCPPRGIRPERPTRHQPVLFQGQEALQVLADVIAGEFDNAGDEGAELSDSDASLGDQLEQELQNHGYLAAMEEHHAAHSSHQNADVAADMNAPASDDNMSALETHDGESESEEMSINSDDEPTDDEPDQPDPYNIFSHPAFSQLNTGSLGSYLQSALQGGDNEGVSLNQSAAEENDDAVEEGDGEDASSSEDNWPGSVGDLAWEDIDDEEHLHSLLDETMAQMEDEDDEEEDDSDVSSLGDEFFDGNEDMLESLETNGHVFNSTNIAQWQHAHQSGNPADMSTSQDRQSAVELDDAGDEVLDFVYFPHIGHIREVSRRPAQLTRFLVRKREHNELQAKDEVNYERVAKNYHLLRTLEKDMELRNLKPRKRQGQSEIGITCPDVLTFGDFSDRQLRPFFRAASRLNMVVHVPELSLVVVGSPVGRVVLLTPTRLASKQAHDVGFWHYGFRVEWILPRASEEIQPKETRRPLHGMAIGPVQEDWKFPRDQGQVDKATMPRRYRLMLHFRNHDIMTFEITRAEQTNKLCIF